MPNVKPTEDEVTAWFDRYSNWGKWGADDLLGTLNYITPEKRVQAGRTVERGVSVSCAWDIQMNTLNDGGRIQSQRLMMHTGLGYHSGSEEDVSPAGARAMDDHLGSASEIISMAFHGRPITHIDALSHIFWKGRMYNDVPAGYVTDRDGATVHDVRSISSGVQSRGVLLDVARAHGRDWFDPKEPIFPDDLEAAERAQGVTVERGDVLLVRTGEGARRMTGNWNPGETGSPGLHVACIPWLSERQIAALGADCPQEVTPSGYENLKLPLHGLAMAAMGLWLIDNCQLEDLGTTCADLSRWSFLFSLGPLRLNGATGSPVNPIALF
jgi:kynurenine formamidase